MNRKVALIIMDGWGHGSQPDRSAIAQANIPFIKSLYDKYSNSELTTFGEAVGLPDGQMGNSEVGHLNIGAGRVVYQELLRINIAIRDGELAKSPKLLDAIKYCVDNNKPLHLMGLVSDGGVHSHTSHLKAICDIASQYLAEGQVFIHAFTDGRDTDTKSGIGYLTDLDNFLKTSVGTIASVCGRYYAMDRDNRWERIKLAYDLLVKGEGKKSSNVLDAIKESYAENVTDEFIRPIIATDANGSPLSLIKEDDVVICFNFRTDRCREITKALTQQDFPEQGMKKLKLNYTTLTVYDHSFTGVANIFDNDDLKMTLGEVLANLGKTQLRAAETEKYPHVTFFFNGGREKPFDGEERIMEPSPKVATYDLQPEMSAYGLTDRAVAFIEEKKPDFVCLNYANADMVGHSGIFSAVVKACEVVNNCVEKLVTTCLANGYSILLTADHGNADYLINDDGSPNTAHTKNPVPLFLIDNELKPALQNGRLADLAPTVLKLMDIPQPAEMTGVALY
ncbi:MAG: 2,3-bisphosphoglycerate-independent phosphoglycerate mutase [Bacteroidetes bacterium]|nr:2,3-bisphosphoglycerate-independent phosphoglycerate mutase [Bacteroidota bacterium]